MSSSGRGGAVREISFWDKQLAEYILSHSVCDKNLNKRAWFAWLNRGLRQWPARRQGMTYQNPHLACIDYLSKHPGVYCEGLYVSNIVDIPEIAVWAVNDDGLHCFSHDLTMPHSLLGNEFEAQKLQILGGQLAVEGPYLFSENPDVIKLCGVNIAQPKWH